MDHVALKKASNAGPVSGVTSGHHLDAPAREMLESQFDHDSSEVRVHTDARAAGMADLLRARAFAYGSHIFFGTEQYAPQTARGYELLTHELAHVVEQQRPATVQRQEIPPSRSASIDLRQLTDEQLHARYDLATATLSTLAFSSALTALLEHMVQDVCDELTRREALKEGRTFTADSIGAMKAYFIANSKKPKPDDCITALNHGVRLLLGGSQKMGSMIQESMAKLQESGRAGEARVIEFEDKNGNLTHGTLAPSNLHESVWDAIVQMAGDDIGWIVFGLSIMDGYHSVTLTLDRNNVWQPHLYWADYWSPKHGWKEYTKATLDVWITGLTKRWWKQEKERNDGKARALKTRVTLWRLHQ